MSRSRLRGFKASGKDAPPDRRFTGHVQQAADSGEDPEYTGEDFMKF